MWKINEKISELVAEMLQIQSGDEKSKEAAMKKYGIKLYEMSEMDKNIPFPRDRISTYRLKTITLDGMQHFYIVAIGLKGAVALDEYDLIAQGWGWRKVRIEPQYVITYGDGRTEDVFSI